MQNTRIFYRIGGRKVGRLFPIVFSCRGFYAQPVGRTFTANGLKGRESKCPRCQRQWKGFLQVYGTRKRRAENEQMI